MMVLEGIKEFESIKYSQWIDCIISSIHAKSSKFMFAVHPLLQGHEHRVGKWVNIKESV